MSETGDSGQLQNFTIDQAAGAFALALGAIGTLLLVIWQSRCLCKCRLGVNERCELFYCERQPPPEDDKKKKKKKETPQPEPVLLDSLPLVSNLDDPTEGEPDTPQPSPEPEPEVEEVVEELVPENP
jgi:hypothetical protein